MGYAEEIISNSVFYFFLSEADSPEGAAPPQKPPTLSYQYSPLLPHPFEPAPGTGVLPVSEVGGQAGRHQTKHGDQLILLAGCTVLSPPFLTS